MIVHDYIKQNKAVVNELYKVGLFPTSGMTNFEIYQFYLDCRSEYNKGESISITAVQFSVSRRSVYTAISSSEQAVKQVLHACCKPNINS